MVSDIKKLGEVIGVLEEQASRVNEFSGVLRAVKEAKEAIEISNIELGGLSEKQKLLVSSNFKNFEEFGVNFGRLEEYLSELGRRQSEFQKKIVGQNKQLRELIKTQGDIQKSISEIDFLTPEGFESGRVATENKLAEQFAVFQVRANAVAKLQESKVDSLQLTTILGMALLACGLGCSILLAM